MSVSFSGLLFSPAVTTRACLSLRLACHGTRSTIGVSNTLTIHAVFT
jgi:hypothetical protein